MTLSAKKLIFIVACTALCCALFFTTSMATAAATTQPLPQVLIAAPVHAFQVMQADTEPTVDTKRNVGKITAVLVSFLGFGIILTGVLCLRHNKKLCFAPAPTASTVPTAKINIDSSAPDSAPDAAMLQKQQSLMADSPTDLQQPQESQQLSSNHIIINASSDSYTAGPAIELAPAQQQAQP